MALIFDDHVTPATVATGPWKLEGYDTFDGEYYSLEGEYTSEADARKAAKARLEELEKTQPSDSSGGQTAMGIQDRVFILGPNGSRYRYTG